jgi:hypothetical protein
MDLQSETYFIKTMTKILYFNFKIGEYVRISEDKKIFDKGYVRNWSHEIYIISNLIPSYPPRYILKDLENQVYEYKFYNEEIQKVLFNEFPYDSFLILSEKNENLLIEKINSNREKEWISKKEFQKYE